ncbi:MAG: hypothetical protein IPM82_25385 [Saprospiraceae bacterium]|nr:hypothetical protein [Saprospiraceae bacterium]
MKKLLLLSAIFFLLGEMLLAQKSPGKVISPMAGTTVPNEELFIVFQKNKELRWEDYTLQVHVDEVNLSTLVKTTGDLLTVLATHRMKAGEHKITVRFSAKATIPLVATWTFNVAGRKNPLPATTQAGQPGFSMRSDLQLQSRLTDLSGPGQFLRQEPPGLHTVNFLGSAFHKNLEIPFRFYVTNQEKSSLQWRNTYMIGLKTKRLGLFAGDVFPSYQRHLLNGSKIRGGRAYVKLRNTTFDVSYGNIQRSLEGELRQYDVALGFPPVNLETSTGLFVVPGSYRRDVLAAQVRFDSKYTKGETSFSFLRGTDKTSSIQYGGPPGQNIVFGFGHKSTTKNDVLNLDFGVSISMTTRDTRGGAASSEEIEEVYGREPPVDPSRVESIFLLNASTTPYRITGFPSASAFANLRLNVLRQHFFHAVRAGGRRFLFLRNAVFDHGPTDGGSRRLGAFVEKAAHAFCKLSVLRQQPFRGKADHPSDRKPANLAAVQPQSRLASTSVFLQRFPQERRGYLFERNGAETHHPDLHGGLALCLPHRHDQAIGQLLLQPK